MKYYLPADTARTRQAQGKALHGGEMRSLYVTLALVAVIAAVARAQDFKNEVAGTVGRTFISDQTVPNPNFFNNTVRSGNGLSFELNYARLVRRFEWADLSIEVPSVFNLDEDLSYGVNQIPESYKSIFVTPAVRVNLIPSMAFSPWVSFGGGLGYFKASETLVFGGTNPGPRGKTTGVMHGAVGLDVRLPGLRSIRFRVEASDNWSGEPPINIDTGHSRQHNYYVGGGLVYHF